MVQYINDKPIRVPNVDIIGHLNQIQVLEMTKAHVPKKKTALTRLDSSPHHDVSEDKTFQGSL
jgi:hypothetical protein